MGETVLLSWDSLDGFQLELHAERGGIAIQLVSVAIDADGTDELRAKPIALARMDLLFKAQVGVEGNPGQLQDASVQLVGDGTDSAIRLLGELEDVESGVSYPVDWKLAVAIPKRAPTSGGPRPTIVDEDDLDWDDETTLEQVLIDVPPVSFGDDDDDDDDDSFSGYRDDDTDDGVSGDDGRGAGRSARGGGGAAALLRALASLDDEDRDIPTDIETPPVTRPYIPTSDDREVYGDDEPSGIHRLVQPRAKPRESQDQSLDAQAEARSLLELLERQEAIEFEEGDRLEQLVPGVTRILSRHRDAESQAKALSAWLIEQEAVLDLYIDDESLAELLETW